MRKMNNTDIWNRTGKMWNIRDLKKNRRTKEMKHITKKAIAIMLTSSMLASNALAVMADDKIITQDELDKLKEELQKEIDHYGEETMIDYVFETCEEFFCETEMAYTGSAMSNKTMVMEDAPVSAACYSGIEFNTEEYAALKENGFVQVVTDPLSTFAADVDTGSYCNLRRMFEDGYGLYEIPGGAVRTEELLNYFDYAIEEKNLSDGKFSLQYELAECPWNPENELLLMTVQANQVEQESEGNNFTFLLDTSGSMDEADKIALAKCSIKLLSYTLTEKDRVSIVTYSGDSYTALDSCPGNDYDMICEVLDRIIPNGGTNGSGGINAAYALAEKNYMDTGNNRVFILSDGDMNLGITSTSGLVDLISEKKETGIFLTVLGFGSGNYSDQNMESIADAGNGNYYYIDCLDEAQHVLIEKQKETTVTVAKDVKFQAEFNPAQVAEYRLIGYENREVADNDFQNDAVDGGEVGAGQQVTLLYELVRNDDGTKAESGLKYQGERVLTEEAYTEELLTVSINYKDPEKEHSETESYVVTAEKTEENSEDMNLAISIAELSMIIHDSSFKGNANMDEVRAYATNAQKENDIYRMGFMLMIAKK